MGLLDGGLQGMFGAAFGGLLLEGRHYHRTEARDAAGNVTSAVTRVQSVRGCRQSMTTAMREAGYSDDSAVLLIMQTYEGRQLEQIARGDRLKLDGQWVAGNVTQDPAHATWVVWATPDG